MKLPEARQRIKEVFEHSFSKPLFVRLMKDIFNEQAEEKNKIITGNYIKEKFKPYVRKYEQVAKYYDGENTIDILIVELHKGNSVERARHSQRNFISEYLKNKNYREAALAAFYSEDSPDWRFSLITLQYSLHDKTDQLSAAKRYSFLVGKNERSHTAQRQLSELLVLSKAPSLQQIQNAFNIETVTKEFFEKYRELFLNLNDHIEKEIKKSKLLREELESRNIDSASFTKKLLGQIVFLYFLQKKGWLGVGKNGKYGDGKKDFLRYLFEDAKIKNKNFYNEYLRFLFYDALANEHRGSAALDYYQLFDCRIPFLNGGLFEADYSWNKIEIDLPDTFFSNKKNEEEGAGILDVFDLYNFTVKEDEPLEKEVAVDPEMLGKVFENLLEIKDRKSKGAFYTPREIVHYMCQESLIAYLENCVNDDSSDSLITQIKTEPVIEKDLFGIVPHQQLNIPLSNKSKESAKSIQSQFRQDIEKFIREGTSAIEHDELKEAGRLVTKNYALPESIRHYAEDLDRALANIRICDPAIGSGAFPVGMMNEIVKAREVLTTYLPGADRSAYEFKRHAIQECIYGVDVDHSAIDIAKLRLWLSLVVDEEDFYKIKPLPNLDYKIVCGNSLIGLPEGIFRNAKLEDEIRELEDELFSITDKEKKDKIRKSIETKIRKLLDSAEEFAGYKIDFDFKIFFSKVFKDKDGFDVVIGNPPYKIISTDDSKIKIFRQTYRVCKGGKVNLYKLFFEQGLSVIKKRGILCYISPSNYLTSADSISLREILIKECEIKEIIDYEESDKVFQSVTQAVATILITKEPNSKDTFIYKKLDQLYKINWNEIIKIRDC